MSFIPVCRGLSRDMPHGLDHIRLKRWADTRTGLPRGEVALRKQNKLSAEPFPGLHAAGPGETGLQRQETGDRQRVTLHGKIGTVGRQLRL